MENEAGSEYLFKKCSRKPLLQGDLSHHGVKEKYQPLYQKLVLNMVEHRGFEPLTSTMRTSVSYTHLDVYKRQEIHLGFVLEDKVVHRPCFLSLFMYD